MRWFLIIELLPGPKPPQLALTLLVARVALADHHDSAVTADHLAVIADGLNAGIDLHCGSF